MLCIKGDVLPVRSCEDDEGAGEPGKAELGAWYVCSNPGIAIFLTSGCIKEGSASGKVVSKTGVLNVN